MSCSQNARLLAVLQAGLAEARQIGHPLLRSRHLLCWSLRHCSVDPGAVLTQLQELDVDPEDRFTLLEEAATGAIDSADPAAGELLNELFETASEWPERARLDLLNSFSERISLASLETEAHIDLLRRLARRAGELPPGDGEIPARALARALVGEALLQVDPPGGRELLDQALEESAGSAGEATLVRFAATALSGIDPSAAAELSARLQEPRDRFDLLTAAPPDAPDSAGDYCRRLEEAADRLFEELSSDERMRAAIRAAITARRACPDLAEKFLDLARRDACAPGEQPPALRLTAIAAEVRSAYPDRCRAWLRDSAGLAEAEEEPLRRCIALALVANEAAELEPRWSSELLTQVVTFSQALESVWQLAHLAEVVLQPRRSPYLDVTLLQPLLERLNDLTGAEEVRIPGVTGPADAAAMMAQVNPARAAELYRRLFETSAAAEDSGAVTAASIALAQLGDPEAERMLRRAAEFQAQRIDCSSLAHFCRGIAAVAPQLALDIAGGIPGARERAQAIGAAAAHLEGGDRDLMIGIVQSLPGPIDRSIALLSAADEISEQRNRPMPEPLFADTH